MSVNQKYETGFTDRLAAIQARRIAKGSHQEFSRGACAMELVSFLAGEPHSDHPKCVSGALTNFMIDLNDKWDDVQRQKLKPFIPRLIGTSSDGLDEIRGFLALDWLIRTWTPAWLDLAGSFASEAQELRNLAPITCAAAADEAGLSVRRAREKASASWDPIWAATADDAAHAAAWSAARAAAMVDDVWPAACAAEDAHAAAHAAAGDATAALKPTVDLLQASALDLLDRMIDGRSATDTKETT